MTYRITPVDDLFQPEMEYVCGHLPGLEPKPMWVPLDSGGNWADLEAYSKGLVTRQSLMSREEAERAIWRAKLTNRVPA